MGQELLLKNTGLNTNSNQLSMVPDGSMSMATNVVIDKDGVVEPRRGFNRLPNAALADATRNDRITSFQDKIIVRRSNDNSMAYYNSGWTNYSGTYAHPTPIKHVCSLCKQAVIYILQHLQELRF